ncbi:MAG: TSUP family transporter [Oscillospiraceae bacterium]|nr:TSUP family transporter [Oscillospiraceae bacterium]
MQLLQFFVQTRINGVALWVVLLMACGVFLASFLDAIAGGGGIISVPTYLIGLHGLPVYNAFGTNKLSSCLGTTFSFGRFAKEGYVNWKLFIPAVLFALVGAAGGTRLQLRTPAVVLKSILLVVLPVVAWLTLKTKHWPEEPAPIRPGVQAAIVWLSALIVGAYDGYYGPGTGTFLMLLFVRAAKLDTRHSAGGVKIVNLASNIGSLITAFSAGTVLVGVGCICAVGSITGHYLGAGVTIRNGSRIVRPAVVIVLVLLTLKILSEFLFPEFWG